jgi:hypothetical protein
VKVKVNHPFDRKRPIASTIRDFSANGMRDTSSDQPNASV